MNRWYLSIGLLLIFSLFSWQCSDNREPLFVMEMEVDFVIPPGLNSFDTHYFIIPNVPTRIQNYLGTTRNKEAIIEVLPNRAELNGLFGGIDWGIVQEVVIHAVPQNNPQLSREIFYQDRINFDNVKELRLFGSLPNVRDILLEDRMTLEIRLNFRRTTPIEIESRLTMNFIVNGPK